MSRRPLPEYSYTFIFAKWPTCIKLFHTFFSLSNKELFLKISFYFSILLGPVLLTISDIFRRMKDPVNWYSVHMNMVFKIGKYNQKRALGE